MRALPFLALTVPLLTPTPARADPPETGPDTTAAFVAGAATTVAGMISGGMVLAAGNQSNAANNTGWLTICGGFTLAPIVAHAVTGEWVRGLVFASLPAATMAGTGALFDVVPGTIDHGTLVQQRLMWALFGVGFLGAGVGVVDASLAGRRASKSPDVLIAPVAGGEEIGLQIAGRL